MRVQNDISISLAIYTKQCDISFFWITNHHKNHRKIVSIYYSVQVNKSSKKLEAWPFGWL